MSQVEGGHTTRTAGETERLGESLAREISAGDVVLLEGDLAAGKTTMVRGLVRGLEGDPDEVASPTFVILRTHSCRDSRVARLHHIDLYRLDDDPHSLYSIGIEEVMSDPDAVVAIEWPSDAALRWLPTKSRRWRVVLQVRNGGGRSIHIEIPPD